MLKPALRDCRPARLFLALAALLALSLPARAAPASLDTDEEMTAFAERVRDYAGASLVRWTVVAPTKAEAEARIAAIVNRLPPQDRNGLAARLIAQGDERAHGAHAYMSPQIGSTGSGSCSWQVWVSDPDLPAPEGQTAMAPLASNDTMPVGPKATFRVGHFGLVQSKLYAFDETQPGAIRDLATVPNVDIPVPKNGREVYIFLASARQSAPFFEGVKTQLSSSRGERRELGANYRLPKNMPGLGAGRGIGSNIEVVSSSMIASKKTAVASAKTQRGPEIGDEVMESCSYSLTPTP